MCEFTIRGRATKKDSVARVVEVLIDEAGAACLLNTALRPSAANSGEHSIDPLRKCMAAIRKTIG